MQCAEELGLSLHLRTPPSSSGFSVERRRANDHRILDRGEGGLRHAHQLVFLTVLQGQAFITGFKKGFAKHTTLLLHREVTFSPGGCFRWLTTQRPLTVSQCLDDSPTGYLIKPLTKVVRVAILTTIHLWLAKEMI